MAICDSKYCFTYVDIGGYGSDYDARIFRKTDLYSDFEQNRLELANPKRLAGETIPPVLVGDEIFPLKPWLTKPIPGPGPLSLEQKKYLITDYPEADEQ